MLASLNVYWLCVAHGAQNRSGGAIPAASRARGERRESAASIARGSAAWVVRRPILGCDGPVTRTVCRGFCQSRRPLAENPSLARVLGCYKGSKSSGGAPISPPSGNTRGGPYHVSMWVSILCPGQVKSSQVKSLLPMSILRGSGRLARRVCHVHCA